MEGKMAMQHMVIAGLVFAAVTFYFYGLRAGLIALVIAFSVFYFLKS
jgi:hypothetical protein